MDRTESKIDTPVARDVSRPVLYELIDRDGVNHGERTSAAYLAELACRLWPDQEQDPDRTGKGWDIQVVS